jgi:hypothetical protein
MSDYDLLVMATLVTRVTWREGTAVEVLRVTEKRAKLRASGRAYSSDPTLDAKVAKLARKLRKQLEQRDRHAIGEWQK